jgi:hypothetical protein
VTGRDPGVLQQSIDDESLRRQRETGVSGIIAAMDSIPPEALLAAYPPSMQSIAERLRTIVRATIPDALERVRSGWRLIGYDVPATPRRRAAYFAYIAPEDGHVHLGFEHGWAMRDPRRHLLGAGITRQVRWLTFRSVDEIDAAACANLLREAAAVALLPRSDRAFRTMATDNEHGSSAVDG